MEHNNASFPSAVPADAAAAILVLWRRRKRPQGRLLTHSIPLHSCALPRADLDCVVEERRTERRQEAPRGFFGEQTHKVGEAQKEDSGELCFRHSHFVGLV